MTTRTAKEIATWLRGNMWSTETLQAFLDSAPAMDDSCTDKIKAENARLREQLRVASGGVENALEVYLVGCGNHGCRYVPVKGIGTNASCSCKTEIKHRLEDSLAKIKEMEGK